MKELEEEIVKFAKDRDWLQFNTPENLAKSISIEAGELLECFQWNNNYNKDELNDFNSRITFDGGTPVTLFIKNGEEKTTATRIIGDVSSEKIIDKLKKNDFIK